MEVLFQKEVPVLVDDKQSNVVVLIQVTPKKILEIQVTDESDPFFLYTLQITESDFHTLKKEQYLVVDFYTFPSTLIELLERCLEETDVAGPPLQCQIDLTSNMLFIVEKNKMRLMKHIALQIKAATDTQLKKYLAGQLKEWKRKAETLDKENLSLQAAVETANALAGGERDERQRRTAEAAAAADAAVAAAQLEADNLLRKERESWERQRVAKEGELREVIARADSETRQLRRSLEESQEELAEVREEWRRAESERDTFRERLRAAEIEIRRTGERTEAELHRQIETLKTTAEDKAALAAHLAQALQTAHSHRAELEASLLEKREALQTSEERTAILKAEVTKGNEIISQLQQRCRQWKAKAQQAVAETQTVLQREHAADATVVHLEKEIQTILRQLEDKSAECQRLQTTIEQLNQKLEESQLSLQKNNNVIDFLNKEVNKAKSSPGGPSSTGSAYQFRPSFKSLYPNIAMKSAGAPIVQYKPVKTSE